MTAPDAFFASMRTDTLREAMGFFVFWNTVRTLASVSWWLHFRVAHPEIGQSLGGGLFGGVVFVVVAPFWMLFDGWLLSVVASVMTRRRQPVTPAQCVAAFGTAPLVVNGLVPWGWLVPWPWAWRVPALLCSYYVTTRGLRKIQKLSPLQSWLVVAVTGSVMIAFPPLLRPLVGLLRYPT